MPATYARLESLAAQGRTLEEIGQAFGHVREWARQAMEHYGLQEIRMRERKEVLQRNREQRNQKKEKQKEHQETIQLLGQALGRIAFQKARTRGEKAALTYYHSLQQHNTQSYSLSMLVRFYTAYYRARGSRKKRSLDSLASSIGLHASEGGKLLKCVGEEPLYGKITQRRYTIREQQMLERSRNLSTFLPDNVLGKMMGVPSYMVSRRREIKRTPFSFPGVAGDHPDRPTILHALEFYDAQDAGFTREDAMQYAGITTEKTCHAMLATRTRIEDEVRRVYDLLDIS